MIVEVLSGIVFCGVWASESWHIGALQCFPHKSVGGSRNDGSAVRALGSFQYFGTVGWIIREWCSLCKNPC